MSVRRDPEQEELAMQRSARIESARRRVPRLNETVPALLDPNSLARTPITILRGIYFLYSRDRLVYVGQSVNIHARIAQHWQTKTFDSFAYIQCDESHLDVLESAYIHRLRPPLNVTAPITQRQLERMNVVCAVAQMEAA